MGTRADELKAEIDSTRAELTETLNEMGDRVSPGRIVARRTDKVRHKANSLKEAVMGTADAQSRTVSDLSGRAGTAVGSAMESAGQAPDRVVGVARGNPIAAGLIAFGAGLLAATAFPSTKVEQEAASRVLSGAQPLVDQARQAAQQVAGNLQDSMGEAVQDVRTAAADAAGTVQDEVKTSAGQVGSAASSAVSDVKDQAKSATQEVRSN